MLILTRKRGETIVIDDRIEVTILEVIGARVRVGIDAPGETSIDRKEVWIRNNAPAAEPATESDPVAA